AGGGEQDGRAGAQGVGQERCLQVALELGRQRVQLRLAREREHAHALLDGHLDQAHGRVTLSGRASSRSSEGVSSSSFFVYSAVGARNSSSTGPTSTIRPSVITAACRAIVRISARLCVTNGSPSRIS